MIRNEQSPLITAKINENTLAKVLMAKQRTQIMYVNTQIGTGITRTDKAKFKKKWQCM